MNKQIIIIVLCLLAVSCTDEGDHITLVYFNDTHEISPVQDELGTRGGIARLKTIIDNIREANSNTTVLFGGDLAGGTLFGAVYKGMPIVKAFNLIPVDLANFGQHDFDFGPQICRQLVDSSAFQWFSTNLVDENEHAFADLPTYYIKLVGNIKIGFIGLTDAMTSTYRSDKVIQQPLLPSARQAISDLKKNNVDFIVVISQANLKANEELLLQLRDIDLIFSEENFETRSTCYYIGNRPIISPCGNTGSLIQVDLKKRSSGISTYVTVHPIDESVDKNGQLLAIQNLYQDSLEKILSEPLARSVSTLDAGINSDFSCRWRETNLGNLITDSYRDYYSADVAVLNGGGIRANIAKGLITFRETWSVLPFTNKICLIRITGKALLRMLEHGVASVDTRSGAFLQISGAQYSYDPKKEFGDRVIEVYVNNLKLKLNHKYTLALPDFILNGGDDFTFLSDAELLIPVEDARLDINIFSDYCRNKKIIDSSIEGRITVIQ